MKPPPVVRTTLLAAALALGVAGCSDAPDPAQPPSSASGLDPTPEPTTDDSQAAVEGVCPLVTQEEVAHALGRDDAPPATGSVDRSTGETVCAWSIPGDEVALTVTAMDGARAVRAFTALPAASSDLDDAARAELTTIVDELAPDADASERCEAWEAVSALLPGREERDGVWTDERQPGLAETCRDGSALSVNHTTGEAPDPAVAAGLLEKVELTAP